MKKYFIWTILSILQLLLLAYISAIWGHDVKFFLVSVIYFLEAYVFLSKSENKKERRAVILILLLPPLIAYLPQHWLHFNETLISLPSTIAHFFGVAVAYLTYYLQRKSYKVLAVGCFIVLTFGVTFKGYKLWMNNINYGSFTSDLDLSVDNFTLSDKYGKAVTNNKPYNTYTVMYFWDTACGYCIQDFPVFQTKLNKYAGSKNIRFIAVNIPLKRDTRDLAEQILNQRGFKFPNYYMRDVSDKKKFTILSFPTTVILRNGKQMIYKGEIGEIDRILN